MKKLLNSKLSLIIFALFFLIACSKKEESSIDSPFSNVFAYVSGDSPLIEMQYEVERIHFQRVIKNNAQSEHEFFDKLAEKPKVSRQKVNLKVSDNGAYYLETIELDPERPTAVVSHNTLPDPTPKVKRTILKGTEMELYSEDGKLLHTSTIQSLDMSEFVNAVKSMKSKLDAQSIADAVSAMQVNKLFGLNISEIEEKVKANGGSVLAEGDYKFIKMPYDSKSNLNLKNTILTIHKDKNLPVASDIVGEDGKSVFRTLYKYNTLNSDNPKLESVVNLHFTKSITGSDVVEENIQKLENMNVKVF